MSVTSSTHDSDLANKINEIIDYLEQHEQQNTETWTPHSQSTVADALYEQQKPCDKTCGQICTNGKDTYHEWNIREHGGCFCQKV